MNAHTPGPWEIGPLDKYDQRIVRSQHIEICTCWHHSVGPIEKQMEANARLIAAAPDMLETLKETVLQLQYLADKFGETGTGAAVLARVQAAIAKAEGRS